MTYNTLLIENLCPGDYTFHLLDGCNQEKTETYTLVDCDIDPLVVEEVNLCRDPRYTDFPITFNGGVGSQILGPYEEGNTVRYVIQDERGCAVEKVFTYAYIDDFDFTVELVKPRTLYSAPIVIVRLEDYDPLYGPYLLFQNGIEYPLEPYQPNEIILTEGTDGTNRFILQNAIGCELVKDIDLKSCSEAEEIRLTTRIDYENDGVLSQVKRRSQCNDHSYLHLSIEGGEPNYRIRIESLAGDPWLYEDDISEETDKYRVDQALPNVPIGITILDECQHRFYQEIEPCDDCDFDYQSVGETGGLFYVGNDGGIEIRVNNPCGIFDFNPFRNTSIEMKISNYQIADWELPITIEWPNGETTIITRNSEGELSLTEKTIGIHNEDDAGPQVVKITRGDGCVIELPIEIKETETTFRYFVESEGDPLYYFGSVKCTKCNALSEAAQYLDKEECNDDLLLRPFRYEPTDENAPCEGGTLSIPYYDTEAQNWRTETIDIMPGTSIGELTEGYPPCLGEFGTCLFPSFISAAIGPGPIPIAASYCILESEVKENEELCKDLNCEAEGLVCNGDGECVDPCNESVIVCEEDCLKGVCVTNARLCDIYVEVNNVPGESTNINIPHNLPTGTIVVMIYNTYKFSDAITVSQDGTSLVTSGDENSKCESTGGISVRKEFEIISSSPISLNVNARFCSSSQLSRYEVSFECPKNVIE